MIANRIFARLVVGFSLGLVACGGDNLTVPPSTGTLEIKTTTGGSDLDPDGYTLQVDTQQPQSIGTAATLSVDQLTPGAHTVALTGLAANCAVTGDNPRTLSVVVGETTTSTFELTCGSTTGALQVTTQTSGDSPDADGYSVLFDGTDRGPVGANEAITLSNLPLGSHVVGLTGVAGNCSVDGGNLRAVTVTAGATADVTFTVTCVPIAPDVGTLRITTTTGGPSQDADGYEFAVDGGQTQPIGLNTSATLTNIAVGSHAVVLSNVAANCAVADGTSRNVTVTANQTSTVTFNVTCSPVGPITGAIHVVATTGGSDQDNAYQFAVDGGGAQAVSANGDQTVSNIAVGRHSVVLSDVAANCTVADGTSRDVTVTPNQTTTVTFNVTCSPIGPTTGAIHVVAATGGSDPDNAYQFAIDGGQAQTVSANGDQTANNLAAGNHTVVLSDVAANCTVADGTSRNATVTANQTSTVTFNVTCSSIGPTTGSIRVATATSGPDADANGYQFAIDGGAAQSVAINGDQTVTNIPAGNHTVVLSDVASNCTVANGTSRNVSVTGGNTSDASFSIACTATGPSASNSTVSANPPDGFEAGSGSTTLTVTVKDQAGSPLAGITVTPSSSGSGNTFTPGSTTTGADGVATFSFSSTVAEQKTVTINAGGVTLNHQIVLRVSPQPTTTTITSVDPEISTSGQSIHVTFTVTGDRGGTPAGTMTVFSLNESGVGCVVDVTVGSCDFVLNEVTTHRLEAVYSGDSEFQDSSDAVDHVVGPAPPAGP